MTWHKEKLSRLYKDVVGDNSFDKVAARGGSRLSRKKLDKKRVDTLQSYHDAKDKTRELEAKKREIEEKLEQSRQSMQESRNNMLRYNDVLRNMDLLACKNVTLYNNSDDVGYLIDKEEHHLDIDDCGDISLTPMKEYRRYLKKQNQEESDEDDSDDYDDLDADDSDDDEEEDSSDAHDGAVGSLISGLDKLTDPTSSWNDNEFTEEKYPSRHPNFRFGE